MELSVIPSDYDVKTIEYRNHSSVSSDPELGRDRLHSMK